SPLGVAAMHACGIAATELRLGYTPVLDCPIAESERDRQIDVTFMGASTPRREALLSRMGAMLDQYRCKILLFDGRRPITDTCDGFVHGFDKLALLASTRVLLNLHRDDRSEYFEWHRCLAAVANGAVLVSESSASTEPLRSGKEMISAPAN